MVVALTLLYCLPTVGSVDSNGLSCSTANGFVAIYYSCTVRIDLLLVGIPFHLLGLHPIAVFCKELHKRCWLWWRTWTCISLLGNRTPMYAFSASALLVSDGTPPSNSHLTMQLRMVHGQLKKA